MNPDTNRFEKLEEKGPFGDFIRPDGSPVPKDWSVFTVGEEITIKDYLFRVTNIGDSAILFEPVGPQIMDVSSEPMLEKREIERVEKLRKERNEWYKRRNPQNKRLQAKRKNSQKRRSL